MVGIGGVEVQYQCPLFNSTTRSIGRSTAHLLPGAADGYPSPGATPGCAASLYCLLGDRPHFKNWDRRYAL